LGSFLPSFLSFFFPSYRFMAEGRFSL
jgi:hypothetical protein